MSQEAMEKTTKIVTWPQWIAGTGAMLLLLQIGLMAGWTSPYVAQLTSPESEMQISLMEASWIVSLLNLGRLFGAIIGAISVNYLGSKTTILVTSIPMAFCWIFTMVANSVVFFYVARFLGGTSLGMVYSSFSIYLGEIADPSIRGALVTLAMSGLSIGNLIMVIMGAYLSIRISSLVSLGFCLVLMALFVWLPESPYHHIKKKSDERTKASILWYHRHTDADIELINLKKFVETNDKQTFFENLKEFKIPQIRKALMVTLVLLMYSQMCGLNNVLFYMETILRNARVTILDPSIIVIIVTLCGIGGSFLSMSLVDKFGRRILMMASCICLVICLICLGTTFELLSYGYDSVRLEPLPIFSMILFQVGVFIGLLSVPNAVLGEIFPPHVKCVAACLGSICAGLFSFASAATYQPLVDLMSEQFVFFLYALLVASAVPFVLFVMPETKGKTLQEIQEKLMRKV